MPWWPGGRSTTTRGREEAIVSVSSFSVPFLLAGSTIHHAVYSGNIVRGRFIIIIMDDVNGENGKYSIVALGSHRRAENRECREESTRMGLCARVAPTGGCRWWLWVVWFLCARGSSDRRQTMMAFRARVCLSLDTLLHVWIVLSWYSMLQSIIQCGYCVHRYCTRNDNNNKNPNQSVVL
jgi:hypothetical protein